MQDKVFGLFKNNVCQNTVIAESKDILEIMLGDEYIIIDLSSEKEAFGIGDEIYNGKLRKASPFPSWTFDEVTWSWIPPTPQPEPIEDKPYIWDENSLSWILV